MQLLGEAQSSGDELGRAIVIADGRRMAVWYNELDDASVRCCYMSKYPSVHSEALLVMSLFIFLIFSSSQPVLTVFLMSTFSGFLMTGARHTRALGYCIFNSYSSLTLHCAFNGLDVSRSWLLFA